MKIRLFLLIVQRVKVWVPSHFPINLPPSPALPPRGQGVICRMAFPLGGNGKGGLL